MNFKHQLPKLFALTTPSSLVLTGCGGSSGGDKKDPEPINSAPTVSITGQKEVLELSTTELKANASDSDGSIVKYAWSVTSGENVTLENPDDEKVIVNVPDVNGDTQVTINVVVTDNKGATATAEHMLTVNDIIENVAPTVSVSGESEAIEKSEITLTASASDMDGSIVSYQWRLVEGDGITLTNTDKESVNVEIGDIEKDGQAKLEVTVTDNQGATATAEFTLLIKAETLAFTIQGKFTGYGKSNAPIFISIGDTVLNSKSDEDGNYSIIIDLDESYTEQLVKLSSSSTTPNTTAFNYESQLLEYGDLMQLSGSDNVLTADEFFAVNLTNFTTALYYSIGNRATLSTTEDVVNEYGYSEAIENIDRATVIKMVADSVDGKAYTLPKSTGTMVELLTNQEAMDEFVLRMKHEDKHAYERNLAVVTKSEGRAVPAITESRELLFTPTFIQSIPARKYVINPDGTGSILLGNGNTEALTWESNENAINIAYSKPVIAGSFSLPGQGTVTEQIVSSRFEYYIDKGNAKAGYLEENNQTINSEGAVIEDSGLVLVGALSFKKDALTFNRSDFIGSWMISDIYNPELSIQANPAKISLSEDGSAIANFISTNDTLQGSWETKNGNLTLTLNENNKAISFTFYVTHKANNSLAFNAEIEKDGKLFVSDGYLAKKSPTVEFESGFIEGHYNVGAIESDSFVLKHLAIYGDGIARTDLNGDNFAPRVDSSGILYLEKFKNSETSSSCRDDENGACVLNIQTSLEPLSQRGNITDVLWTTRYFMDTGEQLSATSLFLSLHKQSRNLIEKLSPHLFTDLLAVVHHQDQTITKFEFGQSEFQDEDGDRSFGVTIYPPEGEIEQSKVYFENGVVYFNLNGKAIQMSLQEFNRDVLTVCMHEINTECTVSDEYELDLRYDKENQIPPV